MPRLLLIFCLAAGSCVVADVSAAMDDSGPPQEASVSLASRELSGRDLVAALIEQLGSDQFTVRRRAEQQLIERGAAAYDQLRQAETDADLEIANRARYILYQIEIAWVRPDDPPTIKRLLTRYPELDQEQRFLTIKRLGQMDGELALAALCRVARYESSPRLARHAALTAMSVEFMQYESAEELVERANQELGDSQRPPVEWIRLFVDALTESSVSAALWADAVDNELNRLAGDSDETDAVVLLKLIDHRLQACRRLELVDETLAALDALIRLSEADVEHRVAAALYLRAARETGELHPAIEARILFLDRGLAASQLDAALAASRSALAAHALHWIIDSESWQVHERFQQQRAEQIEQDRMLSYLTATAYARRGEESLGDAAADRAFHLPDEDPQPPNREGFAPSSAEAAQRRSNCADAIAELGQVEWANREYRYILQRQGDPDWLSVSAASDLAIWLHDRRQYQAASDALGQLCDRLDDDPQAKRELINQLNQRYANGMGAALLKQIYIRRAYYLACHHEANQQYQKQREQLLAATAYFAGDRNAIDPDVLIAMYNSPEADEKFRQRTLAQLRIAKRHFQQRIDSQPDAPWVYNQWAWLVANTEGDFQRAIEYSKKSLKLKPGEPSYLDTLGRCYFAAGDLENAVKYQRRAAERQPHVWLIDRQLKQFEEALASRER